MLAHASMILATITDAVAQTAPATQNTINTTAPVSSDTTISVGTLAGQALMWTVTVFGVPIGTLVTAWVYRLFRMAGVNLTDAARARIQEIVLNGMHKGAEDAERDLAGQGVVAIHNQAVANTVAYVRAHGVDELKQMGVNPNDNAAVDVVKARIAAMAADPEVATPKALDAPPAALIAAAPVVVPPNLQVLLRRLEEMLKPPPAAAAAAAKPVEAANPAPAPLAPA
jgi:hypothetical protein